MPSPHHEVSECYYLASRRGEARWSQGEGLASAFTRDILFHWFARCICCTANHDVTLRGNTGNVSKMALPSRSRSSSSAPYRPLKHGQTYGRAARRQWLNRHHQQNHTVKLLTPRSDLQNPLSPPPPASAAKQIQLAGMSYLPEPPIRNAPPSTVPWH